MKIAQVAPLAESVPPRLYGGTERIVSYHTDELVAMGRRAPSGGRRDYPASAGLERSPKSRGGEHCRFRLSECVRSSVP